MSNKGFMYILLKMKIDFWLIGGNSTKMWGNQGFGLNVVKNLISSVFSYHIIFFTFNFLYHVFFSSNGILFITMN